VQTSFATSPAGSETKSNAAGLIGAAGTAVDFPGVNDSEMLIFIYTPHPCGGQLR
jgi:hypothetical protein